MSDLVRPSGVIFLENSEGEDSVRALIRSFARACVYVSERVIFHWHLYEAAQPHQSRGLLAEYLAHLGYDSSCADGLRELTVTRAYEILEDMLRYDLARHEEMVTEAEARLLADRLREETAAWAALAFTNLKFPEPPTAPLAYYGFLRAVARENIEGGVLLVGEQDIAMIWFLDDDGPTRGIVDLASRAGPHGTDG